MKNLKCLSLRQLLIPSVQAAEVLLGDTSRKWSTAKSCGMETRVVNMLSSCSNWELTLPLLIYLGAADDTCSNVVLICDNCSTSRSGMLGSSVFIAHESAVDRWLLVAGCHRLSDSQWEAAVQSDSPWSELHRELRRHLPFPGF